MSGQEPQENDPLIGTTFADRYQLVSRLGKGGMAVVYKATDKNLGREVALKVLRKDIAADPVAAKRLIREARAAAALHHPHIITIHDVGEYAGTVYVVMEILVGQPLSDVMEEVGALGVERSLNIAEQLTNALSVAHGHNIIHRDIKPENLYLLSAGGGDFVKVLDFSIAKLPTEMVTAALTRAGSVFGTPHYMAPEQVEGKEVGPQTDLYAVGAVLYEMIAGEPPYDGASVIDILLKHVTSPAPQLSRLGIKLPNGLSELCVKLLAKKKQDRPQTASAVREELARMLAEVRHDNESIASGATQSELGADVVAGLQQAGVMPSRPDNPTVREDHPADEGVSAPGARPANKQPAIPEPEARTLAVDTAAITAGVVAARARAMSSGMSPVAAMTIDVEEPIGLEQLPDDLPSGPPPDDLPSMAPELPNTPTAERRKFVAVGDDSSDQRTIVGVGLGKMVAEIARQRATGATAAPALVPAAAGAQPAGPAAQPAASSSRPAAPAASAHAVPNPPGSAPPSAPPQRPASSPVEAPGAVVAGTNRPNAPKPPPPPSGHAHTMARRPPPSRGMPVPVVDDRATTQPGLGLEPVPPPAADASVTAASTQVVRVTRASGVHAAAPAEKPFLPKPVIIVGLLFAAVAVGAALWLLLGGQV